jgi:DNA replication protein DnaC
MNLQQERIDKHCQALKLDGLMQAYSSLASQASDKDWSFLDFLEHALSQERDARQVRSRQTLVRMAGFPAIKTLDDYDYSFAVGAPQKQINELATLRFIERSENAVLLGPSGNCARISRNTGGDQDQVEEMGSDLDSSLLIKVLMV